MSLIYDVDDDHAFLHNKLYKTFFVLIQWYLSSSSQIDF